MKFKNIISSKKLIYFFIGFIILAFLGFKLFSNNKQLISNSSGSQQQDPKQIVSDNNEKVDINREFEFNVSAINDQGQILKSQEKIKFKLIEAELKKDIKLKGESKKANDGQKYLILRIELQNDSVNRVAIISNKYIRLVGEGEKKFSPDFHNAMIAIDPLSVRRDLVAYIVNDKVTNFIFQVGELDGDKQPIEIVF